MNTMTFRKTSFALLVLLLTAANACSLQTPTSPASTTATIPTPTTTPAITGTTGTPGVQVVAVYFDTSQQQNPGGPTVIMELKNIATEALVSLDVKLYEPTFAKSWTFNFVVSQTSLLVPGVTIGLKQNLIGPSGWGTGIPYFVTISGNYADGTTFSFRWNPPGDGDFKLVGIVPVVP